MVCSLAVRAACKLYGQSNPPNPLPAVAESLSLREILHIPTTQYRLTLYAWTSDSLEHSQLTLRMIDRGQFAGIAISLHSSYSITRFSPNFLDDPFIFPSYATPWVFHLGKTFNRGSGSFLSIGSVHSGYLPVVTPGLPPLNSTTTVSAFADLRCCSSVFQHIITLSRLFHNFLCYIDYWPLFPAAAPGYEPGPCSRGPLSGILHAVTEGRVSLPA